MKQVQIRIEDRDLKMMSEEDPNDMAESLPSSARKESTVTSVHRAQSPEIELSL